MGCVAASSERRIGLRVKFFSNASIETRSFTHCSMVLFTAWVYIMTNWSKSVLYTGFSTDLPTRAWEHRTKQNPKSFTARYEVNRLVYYQGFLSVDEAEKSERYIKGKKREWKKTLISKHNPEWRDLTDELKG
jgi:putative endonuclease